MIFSEFLETLAAIGWQTSGKSYAFRSLGEWQVAFIRLGGRLQREGMVSFVVCVRHTSLRNLEKQLSDCNKNPNAYPLRFTIEHIRQNDFSYKRELNYQISYFPTDGDWSELLQHLATTIPRWVSAFSRAALVRQIKGQVDDPWYVENIWLEDLT
ncbi:MAG: hypothetical protein H7Y60_11760 [Rhodospirillaceae bacterium]|nr:hypothetical protein [Rhodospirillales bacterium]